jgi:Tfp pilus assembly protein PilF
MSLLLDALQRASQEKERAAQQNATRPATPEKASTPAAVESPAPVTPLATRELSIEPLPELNWTVEPSHEPASAPETPPASQAAPATEPGLGLDLAPLDLPPPPAPPEPSPPAQPNQPTPPVRNADAPQPSPALEPAPTEIQTPPPSLAATPAPTAPAAPITPAAPPPLTSDTARDILKAIAPPKRMAINRRTIAFMVVAIMLGTAVGSLYLGIWDESMPSPNGINPNLPATTPSTTEPIAAAPADPAVTTPADGSAAPTAILPAEATPATPAAQPIPSAQPPAPKLPVATTRPTQPATAPTTPTHRPPAAARRPANPPPHIVLQNNAAQPLERAYAALTAGRFDEAQTTYRQVLGQRPEERDALLGLAYIAHRQNHLDEARDYYRRVLRQDPDHAVAQAGLLALQNDSDAADASAMANDLTERQPRSAAAFAALGHAQVRAGRLADAQQSFFTALTIAPDNGLHAYNLAVALDRLHKPGQALTYYERAERLLAGHADPQLRAAALERIVQLRNLADRSASPQGSPP